MKTANTILIALLFIFSFLFIKEGITGMFTFKDEDVCSYNTECLLPKVCCRFYEEEKGIGSWQQNCDSINLITKQEKLQITAGKPLTQQQIEALAFTIEKPEKIKENSPLIMIGLILLILATMYLVNRTNKEKRLKRNKEN